MSPRTPSDRPSTRPASFGSAFNRRASRDLEPIFGDPVPAMRKLVEAPGAAPRLIRPRRRAGVAGLGALAAAGLVGLSAGALIGKAPRSQALAEARPATPAAIPVQAAPQAAPVQTALDLPREDLVRRLAAQPAPVATAPVATAPVAATQPAATAPRVQRVRTAHKAAPRRCGGRCAYDDLLDADRALRRAYARAIRSGAPHAVLTAERDRWDDLRGKARRDPAGAAAGYRRLSARLDLASDRAERRNMARESTRRGLFERIGLW